MLRLRYNREEMKFLVLDWRYLGRFKWEFWVYRFFRNMGVCRYGLLIFFKRSYNFFYVWGVWIRGVIRKCLLGNKWGNKCYKKMFVNFLVLIFIFFFGNRFIFGK